MNRRSTTFIALAGVALAMALAVATSLAACSSPDDGDGGPYGGSSGSGQGTSSGTTVVEKDTLFQPSTLVVDAGETVTFVNEDSTQHEVEIDGRRLGRQDSGETVTWKAEDAGSYDYVCTIHPSMTGTIEVR